MSDIFDVETIKQLDQQHHFHARTNPVQLAKEGPVFIDKGEGIYIYDETGRKIIDGLSGGYCTNIGYGNERICNAAYKAMQSLSYGINFGRKTDRWTAGLSKKLSLITPESFQHFFFSSTGSDAVESSIKMALYYWRLRGQPKKRQVIVRQHSYHGNTLFATGLSGIGSFPNPIGSVTDLISITDSPYWYAYGRGRSQKEFGLEAAAALEQKILDVGAENIAAFIGEPIQATCNVIIPPMSYWSEVRRICDQYDILLIADEVVTGLGKTGYMFGFQAFDFEPDLFVMAKGLSSGYFPVSSVAIGEKVSEVLQASDEPFPHGYTNCGHPVGSAVVLENIAVIEDEDLVEKVRQDIGPYLAQRLKEFLMYPCVGDVRSMGIICAIEIDMTKIEDGTQADSLKLVEKIGDLAWDKGLNARPVGTALGMIFPMIISKSQIDDAINILKVAFEEAVPC